MRTRVKSHPRRTKKSVTRVKPHSRKIGTSWSGPGYVHGPRLANPKKFSQFRLGEPNTKGERIVFGKLKGTNKWVAQSTIRPKK